MWPGRGSGSIDFGVGAIKNVAKYDTIIQYSSATMSEDAKAFHLPQENITDY